MKKREFPNYLPHIVIHPEPSIADPAHLIAYHIPNVGMIEGGRVVRFLIWLLTKFIRHELKTEYIHTNNPVTEKKLNKF